jgi:predicted aldo/keto reductase-like oxidoreductase
MVMRSFAKRFPPDRFFTERFSSVIEKATECSDCGECETRCPYHLPIREMMSEQVDWYRDEYRKHCA